MAILDEINARAKRCLMLGGKSSVKPLSAGESSGSLASDELSQLELHLQRQLEDDVARIFDESIYSDLEVVCGKLKILTHSCILKARTHNFYQKLEEILHANIGRNTFDEIYSFISDAYTECNIQQQEKEIIKYLNKKLNLGNIKNNSPKNKSVESEEPDVYSTPNCVSPEEKSFQKTLSSSPSTELTKEYYALVPIDGNILEKELIEQDVLSNAFQSINKSKVENTIEKQNKQCTKPTSLYLNSSQVPKINKHSTSCYIFRDNDLTCINFLKNNVFDENKINIATSQVSKSVKQLETDTVVAILHKNSEISREKNLDPTYSPDSLITDDPSSSSDYLSAAYASPGAVFSSGFSQLNVGENAYKMDNIITISDSGLETTGMLESLNSHKDVTLTDVSLTESTIDMVHDDANYHEFAPSTLDKHHIQKANCSVSLHSPNSSTSTGKYLKERNCNKSSLMEMSGTPTIEEKQRQNEEIVIFESSSLSSETGSWESVFPTKLPEKDLCEKFINSERKSAIEIEAKNKPYETSNVQDESYDELCTSLVQKSPFKSTSCFIDASSLADESDEVLIVHTETNDPKADKSSDILSEPNRTVSSASRRDLSPNDWSGSDNNEDSLEQGENKDSDSIQKDLSPTIFELTPTTEDSLCANAFEASLTSKQIDHTITHYSNTGTLTSHNNASATPNNSMVSLGGPNLMFENDENNILAIRNDNNLQNHIYSKDPSQITPREFFCEQYISDEVSVEDNLPQLMSIPEPENPEKPQNSSINATYWVVDMSSGPKSDISECSIKLNDKLVNKTVVISRPASKSTSSVENCKSLSSVDSDSSEKSNHKFYIDLSTLPDVLTPEQSHGKDDINEKKNIFPMFIDLGDESTTLKEMPARLSSSLHTKKNSRNESKCISKKSKASNTLNFTCATSVPNQTEDSLMFEKLESLCEDTRINISEIISNPYRQTEDQHSDSIHETNEIITKVIEEKPALDETVDLFVKLSDLDKPTPKAKPVIVSTTKECHERMTRSIPDKDWGYSNPTVNLRSSETISSFHSENALSLNRLFPHLKDDFSRSMPGSLSSRTKSPLRLAVSSSPGDMDEQASDMSEMSSVLSSYCRSAVDNSSTEETDQNTSLMKNCQSRLGQDLLRIFLEEVLPDVIVEVAGRRIKAHKCILSSRCQYFAGILSGGWVESAGNVISLPSFSYNVVHFALCHIYSGTSVIPESISIVELATLADMLCLEGLKEVIMFTLKSKYCHHFHKPCTLCIPGVLECLILSSLYGLDDLCRKCLRWITKHFVKVWPTKAFAMLPSELLNKCYQEQVVNFTAENIVETMYGCGITVASLTSSRWAEQVARMCQRLGKAAVRFVAERLSDVLRAMSDQSPHAAPPALQALDDCMTAAIEWAPPEQACRAYGFLSALHSEMRAHHCAKPDLVANDLLAQPDTLLSSRLDAWRIQCQRNLLRDAPRVVATDAFMQLPEELRTQLYGLGCVVYAAPPPISGARSLQSRMRSQRRARSCGKPAALLKLDMDHVRACFVPYSPKPPPPVVSPAPDDRTPRANKPCPPNVKTTKAQEKRAEHNLNKTQKLVNVTSTSLYNNAKPRYLEPRAHKEESRSTLKKTPSPGVLGSDTFVAFSPLASSSPLKTRAPRLAIPPDDAAFDSSTESRCKYDTYTKPKRTASGSVESVTTMQQKAAKQCSPSISTKDNKNPKMTKIPVYKYNKSKVCNAVTVSSTETRPRVLGEKAAGSRISQASQKAIERKPSGSLMSSTKSSQAKIVPKTVKQTTHTKNAAKQDKAKRPQHRSREDSGPSQIPIMERSGTFLKDEPTFKDKAINIDGV